jgi:regulatory protein
MKIEAIEQTRSPQGKLRLRFEDGTSLMVYPALLVDLGLYTGMEISPAAMESLKEQNGALSAKERATRILSYGVVSGKELEHRLRQKGESEEHAQEAVQWLQELRLLDDRQAAEQIVRSGLSKGYGPARIRQMLYEKRIPKELWQEVLADLPEADEAIDHFLNKRFRGKTPDRAECKRATDALLRRGHSWSDIRRALERYAPEEEFEE